MLNNAKEQIKRIKEIIRKSSMCSTNYPYCSFDKRGNCRVCGHHTNFHVFAHGISDCSMCDKHDKSILEEIENVK